MTSLSCYVIGCHATRFERPSAEWLVAVRSVMHARFGRVTACPEHDPARFGVALPLSGLDVPVEAPSTVPEAPGGAHVRRSVPVPVLPGSGGALRPHADLDDLF